MGVTKYGSGRNNCKTRSRVGIELARLRSLFLEVRAGDSVDFFSGEIAPTAGLEGEGFLQCAFHVVGVVAGALGEDRMGDRGRGAGLVVVGPLPTA